MWRCDMTCLFPLHGSCFVVAGTSVYGHHRSLSHRNTQLNRVTSLHDAQTIHRNRLKQIVYTIGNIIVILTHLSILLALAGSLVTPSPSFRAHAMHTCANLLPLSEACFNRAIPPATSRQLAGPLTMYQPRRAESIQRQRGTGKHERWISNSCDRE